MAFGLEAATLTVPTAMVMGLAFGAGPCNLTCLPYLGPVFVTDHSDKHQAWRTVAPFSAGRLVSYGALGLFAGMLGQALESWLASPLVGWILGLATIAVGLSLLWRRNRTSHCQRPARNNTVVIQDLTTPNRNPVLPGGLFVMGAGMALNPCAPLATILLAASVTGSATTGLGLGLGFGVGAVVIPTLVFAIGVAHFGRQLREHLAQWRPALERLAALMLVLLGLSTALGGIRP